MSPQPASSREPESATISQLLRRVFLPSVSHRPPWAQALVLALAAAFAGYYGVTAVSILLTLVSDASLRQYPGNLIVCLVIASILFVFRNIRYPVLALYAVTVPFGVFVGTMVFRQVDLYEMARLGYLYKYLALPFGASFIALGVAHCYSLFVRLNAMTQPVSDPTTPNP